MNWPFVMEKEIRRLAWHGRKMQGEKLMLKLGRLEGNTNTGRQVRTSVVKKVVLPCLSQW